MPENTSDSLMFAADGQRRVVGILTTSRADSGISRWIAEDLAKSQVLQPLLIAAGDASTEGDESGSLDSDSNVQYLIPRRGSKNPLQGDRPVDVAGWVAACMSSAVSYLDSADLSVLVVVGDRIEVLAIAQAAAILGIPIAHVHGGEVSFGALDERCRHAITKLADVHFVATEKYGRRVMQMGEDPERVFVVGAPGLCALERLSLATRAEVEDFLGLPAGSRYFLATYHPETTDSAKTVRDLEGLLAALREFTEHHVIFTGVNADPGYDQVVSVIHEFVEVNSRFRVLNNLGHEKYLAALKYADVCVGNSSSGIIEAPSMHTPTVNVGGRQDGRERASTVIDASSAEGNIARALHAALSVREKGEFDSTPPYGNAGASARIVRILEDLALDRHAAKFFHDYPDE